VNGQSSEAVIGRALAQSNGWKIGDVIETSLPYSGAGTPPVIPRAYSLHISGIVSGDATAEGELMMPLKAAQALAGKPDDVSRIEISARTKPEDAFGRANPDTLSPKMHEVWYCSPYANSIAYQIAEALPGAQAEQVRRVEQSEGTVLERISGLMWLVSAAALLAAGFAVSAAMATAVLERQGEIGLMRSLGASKGAIALLFYAETGLLAVFAGALGYLLGSGLAGWLGARIFEGDGGSAWLNPVLLPVVVALALVVALAGSTPSIRSALGKDPSAILRADA
jgi:putative ABC transport system permease protein